jgi:hypothetical protein
MRKSEKKKLRSWEDEMVGAAFSRDNGGGLAIDGNRKKVNG